MRPDVTMNEVDLSLVIKADVAFKAAIVLEANKGTLDRMLISNNQQFIEEYGYADDSKLGMYCAIAFLEKGNALEVQRVVGNDCAYAGVIVKNATAGTIPAAVEVGIPYGSHVFGANELFLLALRGPGAYGNGKIAVSVTDIAMATTGEFQLVVKELNSEGVFAIKETWNVSRKTDAKDGFGRSMFIEDVINEKSAYIVALNNSVITDWQDPLFPGADIEFDFGADGDAVVDGDVTAGIDTFASKDEVDFEVFINGGYTSSVVQQKIASVMAARRGVGILDAPYGLAAAALKSWREGQNIDSSFGSAYANWVQVYDQDRDKYVWVPPSGAVAADFAYSSTVANEAKPVAGLRRGKVSGMKLERAWTPAEEDVLYDAQINYLTYKRGAMYIWGNKTMQIATTYRSYLSVRRVLNKIENAIYPALDNYLFEVNDAFTRMQCWSVLNDYIKLMVAQGMLLKGEVVCDETNNTQLVIDQFKMHVDVYLKVAPDIENIRLQMIVTKSGVSFEELIATGGNF